MSKNIETGALETGASETATLMGLAEHFVSEGTVTSVEPLGNGNINSTFLVTVAAPNSTDAEQTEHVAKRFVLQRINSQVFQQPELVIQNMAVLTEHLQDCAVDEACRWETPRILPTNTAQNFWQDDAGEYWRAISFIEDSQVCETVESVAHAKEVGYGLAMFHRLISTIAVDRLADTLEGFHITPSYLAQYEQVLTTWKEPVNDNATNTDTPATNPKTSPEEKQTEAELVQYCQDFVEQRKDWAHVLERAKDSGELHLRPIHGDPKVNNILLDADGKAISLIDLDTLKPGLVHYDIGDCLRSGCNPLGEETEDWQSVEFDTELAKAMLEGYLSLAKDFLTEQDYHYLYDAIRLIAFELGLRFFTDHLAGNVYFKVDHPTHNLSRALVQFKLTESIEAQSETLKDIILALQ